MNQSEIILYRTEDGSVKIDTIFQDETIWLTQSSMAELFGVNVPAISKHLKNIYEEGELQNNRPQSSPPSKIVISSEILSISSPVPVRRYI